MAAVNGFQAGTGLGTQYLFQCQAQSLNTGLGGAIQMLDVLMLESFHGQRMGDDCRKLNAKTDALSQQPVTPIGLSFNRFARQYLNVMT